MKVLEISDSAAAGYAGCLLAAIDIEVARILPAAGRLQQRGAGYESEGGEYFLHQGKTAIAPARPRRATAASVDVGQYDLLIEDVGPKGLRSLGWSYRSLRAAHPEIVIVSLSAFGRTGPYSAWRGNDFLAQAVGGVMHTSGYDGEAPLALPGEAAFMVAGLHGASAALAATFDRSPTTTELGLHIDISAQDTFMQHWTRHVAEHAYRGTVAKRGPRNPEGLHYHHTAMAADGWLYVLALREPWQDLAAFLGLEQFLMDDAFDGKPPPWRDMEQAFHEAVAGKSKYQWFAEAAEMGWTFAPVEDPFEIAASPQMAARGGMLIADSGHSEHGEIQMPPLPWVCDD